MRLLGLTLFESCLKKRFFLLTNILFVQKFKPKSFMRKKEQIYVDFHQKEKERQV